MNKFLNGLAIIIVLGALSFISYGVKHQCPDVAIFVYCENK